MTLTLTPNQAEFAKEFSQASGLDPYVVEAWLYQEENGTAAESYQARNFNDWLNIGITGSGSYGTSDAIWQNPDTAAVASAQWLAGKPSVAGYGTASSGIRSIAATAGKPAADQIVAIRSSGWAGSGYPEFEQVYQQAGGELSNNVGQSDSGFFGSVETGTSDIAGTAVNTGLGALTVIPGVNASSIGLGGGTSSLQQQLLGDVLGGIQWERWAEIIGGGVLVVLGIAILAFGKTGAVPVPV